MNQPTRTIKLTRGFVATVDADLYNELNKFNWYAKYNTFTRSWYACRPMRVGDKFTTQQMARQVLGLQPGDPRQADHKETGATLLNTMDNLRISTATQNCCNRRKRSDNSSSFKGVSWDRNCCKAGKWRTQITINGKTVLVGHYTDPILAAQAYDDRARQEFGPFALCNFPIQTVQPTFELPLVARKP